MLSSRTDDPQLEEVEQQISGVNFQIDALQSQLRTAETELRNLTYLRNRLVRLRREANGEKS